jgi:hypothetical protein
MTSISQLLSNVFSSYNQNNQNEHNISINHERLVIDKIKIEQSLNESHVVYLYFQNIIISEGQMIDSVKTYNNITSLELFLKDLQKLSE